MGQDADCYTLLADDSSAFSFDAGQYKAFKAHLIYSLIVNGGIVFSDNQAVASRNLRLLTRSDGVVRQSFKDGMLTLAMRECDGGTMFGVREVHEAFVAEGKVRPGTLPYDAGPELDFLQDHAAKRSWSYQQVRDTYTRTCEDVLLIAFRERLDPDDFHRFRDLIATEKQRDRGLGRQYLQYRLLDEMTAAGIAALPDAPAMLRRCTDAPYVSNLPKVMGLNPIYAPEHRESFELVRGQPLTYHDLVAPRDLPVKLSFAHFVEGLTQLDMDDIVFLQATPARTAFIAAQDAANRDAAAFDVVEEAFLELNIEIEDRIVSRFPGLRRHSPAGAKKRLRKQYATGFQNGVSVTMDVLALALDFVSAVPFLGTGTKIVFDRVSDHIEFGANPRARTEVADYLRQKAALEAHLRSLDRADKLAIEEIVTTAGFERETMVS